MLRIETTEQFAQDIKKQKALGQDMKKLRPIIEDLVQHRPLALFYCDNPIPNGRGRWNCRVSFNWWLIYKCDMTTETIILERTGSVKDLFE